MNKSLKALFIATVSLASATAVQAQNFGDMLNDAAKKNNINIDQFKGKSGSGSSISNLSSSEITNGLKQALQVGIQNSAQRLGSVNGYFGNSLIKILMPPEAQQVQSALDNIGMGSLVDKAVLSMNRAAEDAAPKAVSIFVDAIRSMSIQDGVAILKGNKDAATQYLRVKTTAALTAAFRPIINASLGKVDATRYWSDVFTTYNKIPFTSKVNPDLTAYVTERALNGLFISIAEEEAKIRSNPSARVTGLLQKVFSAR